MARRKLAGRSWRPAFLCVAAGLRQDVLLEVNRQPVKKVEDVATAIGKMKEGEMALLRVRRGDSALYLAVPVGGRQ